MSILNFYVDDSGTRHPNRQKAEDEQERSWFALGGVLIKEDDEGDARRLYNVFRDRWPQTEAPLHSIKIRKRKGPFKFVGTPEGVGFMEDLENLLIDLPVRGMGCVIDRPGYLARYTEKYGRQKWALCKTAFSIAVERAAKIAASEGCKLRVLVEKSDKSADRMIRQYYTEMKTQGMPFSQKTSSGYEPLAADQIQNILYELRFKSKTSPIMQVADLFIYPLCAGAYREYYPYNKLYENNKIVDTHLTSEQLPKMGVKYSCFELVEEARKQKGRENSRPSASLQYEDLVG